MFPSPSELLYFIEVSEVLNVSRAAERLGVSQPTLSLSIKRLEDYVGTSLLIRNKSGVKLTAAGKRLSTYARQLLQEWKHIKNDIVKTENVLSGRYTIGCHSSVALYSIPHFLPNLISENPELELHFIHDLSRKITEEIIRFNIDFGIVVNPIPHPDLIIRPLTVDTVTLFTSKNPSPSQTINSEKAVLVCDPDLLQTQTILKEMTHFEIKFPRIIFSSNLDVVATMVANKIGIGILPERVATRLTERELTRVKGKIPEFKDRICLIYRADVQRSKAARELGKKIENSLKDPT